MTKLTGNATAKYLNMNIKQSENYKTSCRSLPALKVAD